MAESSHHAELVLRIVQWVYAERSDKDGLSVLADTASFPRDRCPRPIGGFVPDVHACTSPSSLVILGEAKTFADTFVSHTASQVRAYLEYLALQPDPIFVMATPFAAAGAARSLVRRLQRDTNSRHVGTVFLFG